MKIALVACGLGLAVCASALAVEPAADPDHDHRHGARMAKADARTDVPHMTLIQAAQYISAQVPGELREVEAHPGAPVYHVDMELINGARARLEVNAHDGTVSWHQPPVLHD
ncbi:MAG TPA: hypothetical protein VLS49_12880 [Usitatibacter sp.]|nr:hypothetical protein [Usitatibacter sp.]